MFLGSQQDDDGGGSERIPLLLLLHCSAFLCGLSGLLTLLFTKNLNHCFKSVVRIPPVVCDRISRGTWQKINY
jgi:hypothetical protein